MFQPLTCERFAQRRPANTVEHSAQPPMPYKEGVGGSSPSAPTQLDCGGRCALEARTFASIADPPRFLRSDQRSKEPAMRALVYHGPGNKAWEEVAQPTIISDTDAIVRVDAVTICGTDLHILKGDVPGRDRRADPRPRGGRHRRGGRRRREERQGRRQGPRVVHHRLRRVPLLPRRVGTASASAVAVGSSATRSTAPRPSTSAFRSPTRRPIPPPPG